MELPEPGAERREKRREEKRLVDTTNEENERAVKK